MPTKLEFRECPHCGKSIRADIDRCHRCKRSVVPRAGVLVDRVGEAHAAVPYGGYDDHEDDFDYDAYIEKEFGKGEKRPRWKSIVGWTLIFAFLFPLLWGLVSILAN